jgi:hypothetical protein
LIHRLGPGNKSVTAKILWIFWYLKLALTTPRPGQGFALYANITWDQV